MAVRRHTTLPEKKRTDSESDIHIIGIEKRTNTVSMCINGCHVTAVCQERNNTEAYNRVKGILIDSVLSKSFSPKI